jgi:Galactose oxidase, central domain
MAYDTVRQRVVLFGGSPNTTSAAVNDTWEYDGTTWTQRTPATSPPARNSHAMVYDSTHQVTVLFGGCCNDTWLWNGTTWTAPMPVQTAPVVDMSTRPDGIWHYTTIDIPAGTTVSFKPNAANTPVVCWLLVPCALLGQLTWMEPRVLAISIRGMKLLEAQGVVLVDSVADSSG